MSTEKTSRQSEKFFQVCECLIPNLVGLYLNSNLGFVLSVCWLLSNWFVASKLSQKSKVMCLVLPILALSLALSQRDKLVYLSSQPSLSQVVQISPLSSSPKKQQGA